MALDAINQTNAAFYRAFEALDLRAMEEVWAHGEHVKCVHPGWPLLTGWEAVRASWETIFLNTQEMRFTLTDVRTAASVSPRSSPRSCSSATGAGGAWSTTMPRTCSAARRLVEAGGPVWPPDPPALGPSRRSRDGPR